MGAGYIAAIIIAVLILLIFSVSAILANEHNKKKEQYKKEIENHIKEKERQLEIKNIQKDYKNNQKYRPKITNERYEENKENIRNFYPNGEEINRQFEQNKYKEKNNDNKDKTKQLSKLTDEELGKLNYKEYIEMKNKEEKERIEKQEELKKQKEEEEEEKKQEELLQKLKFEEEQKKIQEIKEAIEMAKLKEVEEDEKKKQEELKKQKEAEEKKNKIIEIMNKPKKIVQAKIKPEHKNINKLKIDKQENKNHILDDEFALVSQNLKKKTNLQINDKFLYKHTEIANFAIIPNDVDINKHKDFATKRYDVSDCYIEQEYDEQTKENINKLIEEKKIINNRIENYEKQYNELNKKKGKANNNEAKEAIKNKMQEIADKHNNDFQEYSKIEQNIINALNNANDKIFFEKYKPLMDNFFNKINQNRDKIKIIKWQNQLHGANETNIIRGLQPRMITYFFDKIKENNLTNIPIQITSASCYQATKMKLNFNKKIYDKDEQDLQDIIERQVKLNNLNVFFEQHNSKQTPHAMRTISNTHGTSKWLKFIKSQDLECIHYFINKNQLYEEHYKAPQLQSARISLKEIAGITKDDIQPII